MRFSTGAANAAPSRCRYLLRIQNHSRPPSSTTQTYRYLSHNNNLPASSSSNAITTTPTENALTTPINFDTSSSIQGEESQILQIKLQPNQTLRAESGAMLFMTEGVEMGTSLGAKEGSTTTSALSDGFRRMMTGQNMFLSDFTFSGKEGTEGTIALGTDFPSKIIRFSLPEYGNKIVCQKGAYLASSMDVDIQMEFTKKFTAGFFGGEGFILQSLTGGGDVFVKAGGTLVKKDLDEGETLRVSSGSLVAFTQDVEFDVQTMPGFKNVMFGGEGLFVTTLTGPGTVWLQGMPPDRMISEIARRVPSGGGIGLGIPIGMGGGGGGTEGVDGTEEASAAVGEGNDTTIVDSPQGEEDLVAATDAQVEMDRNATVASSGFEGHDSESASSLFGDAAQKDEATYDSSGMGAGNSAGNPPENSMFDNDQLSDIPEMDDATSFSTQDADFGEDLTSEQQFDDFQQDETSFSTDIGGGDDGASSDSEGGGILRMIWDFLRDDD